MVADSDACRSVSRIIWTDTDSEPSKSPSRALKSISIVVPPRAVGSK